MSQPASPFCVEWHAYVEFTPKCDCLCASLQELKDFQRDGHSLEDLWKVAKGDIKYQDFVGSSIPRKQEGHSAPLSPPEDLVRPCHNVVVTAYRVSTCVSQKSLAHPSVSADGPI